MRDFILLLIFLLLKFGPICAQVQEEPFIYNDGGRRDPFLPLVDKDGKYRLASELVYSAGELSLCGILWDPQGKSSCLINNQVLKVGEAIGGFTVADITKNSVLLCKEGKEYIIRLPNELEE